MPGTNSPTAEAWDVNELQTVAARWLMSVHAVWDPRLDDSHLEKDALRLIFRDSGAQEYTVLMGPAGEVISYRGPGPASRREDESVPAPRTAPAAPEQHKERTAPLESGMRPPPSSPFVSIQEAAWAESAPPEAAGAGRFLSPEDRVLGWIRESIGLSRISIIERNDQGPMSQYRIVDDRGGNYLVVAEQDGTVTKFEPVAGPPEAAERAEAARSDRAPVPATVAVPSRAPAAASAAPASAETARLVSVAKNWLSSNIGLNEVEVQKTLWEDKRLRLDFADRSGNSYRLFIRPSGKIEEFKPL